MNNAEGLIHLAPDAGGLGWRMLALVARFLFVLVIVAGCLPLATYMGSIQVVTPYVVLCVLGPLVVALWLLRPLRVVSRGEEVAFVFAPVLTLCFSAASVDPQGAVACTVPALYAAMLFLVARYCLVAGIVDGELLFRVIAVAFWGLTLVAITQALLNEPIGVVANYFGAAEEPMLLWGRLRVSATFDNPNVFAQVHSIFGAVVAGAYLFAFRQPRLTQALIVSSMAVVCTAASLSRSGMLMTIVLQGALYTYACVERLGRKERQTIFSVGTVLAAALLAGSLFAGGGGGQDGGRFSDADDGGRIETYLGALELLREPQVMVVGLGSGQFFTGSAVYGLYYEYKSWRPQEELGSSVHNWTLMIASENGVIVLALYLYALFGTMRRAWLMRRYPGARIAAIVGIILAALYGIAFQFGTTGVSPWMLTPVAIMMAFVQGKYDWVLERRAVRSDASGQSLRIGSNVE